MSLLTRRERRMIGKSFKFSGGIIVGLLSCIVSIIVLDMHLIVKGYKWIKNYIHYRKVNLSHLQIQKLIKRMSPRQFEIFCCELFKANGHKARLTPPSNDYGRDIIIDKKIFVECKHYSEYNFIGREILQKLVGSMEAFNINHGMVITTGKIHSNAIEYAKRVSKTKLIELIDMNDIMDFVFKTPVSKLPFIMAQTFSNKNDDEILEKIEHFANRVEEYE